MKNRIPEILAAILFCLAVLLLFHQRLFANHVWFSWQEFWHHESVIACCVVAAIALVVGKYLGSR